MNKINLLIYLLLNISRADYWKSNERKHCDYCNCWIADNKAVSKIITLFLFLKIVFILSNQSSIIFSILLLFLQSIAFHEGGKKHKANVAKKLYDIGRKSQKDERERQKMDAQFRQMEDAALKAYAKDIKRAGDITTQELNAQVAAATAAAFQEESSTNDMPGPSLMPTRKIDPMLQGLPEDFMEEEEKEKRAKLKRKANATATSATSNGSKEQSMWIEAKNDDGYTYYWNVKTGGNKLLKHFLFRDSFKKSNEIYLQKVYGKSQKKDS